MLKHSFIYFNIPLLIFKVQNNGKIYRSKI